MLNIFASINMPRPKTIKGLKNRMIREFISDDDSDSVIESIAEDIIWWRDEINPPPYYSSRYSRLEKNLYLIPVLDRLENYIKRRFHTNIYGMKLFLFIDGTFFLPKHSEPFIQDLFIVMFGRRKVCVGDRTHKMDQGDGLYVPFEQNISEEIYIPPDDSVGISFIIIAYIDTPFSIKLENDKPLVKAIDEDIDPNIIEMIKNPFMGYIDGTTF